MKLKMPENNHTISFDVSSDTGEVLKSVITLDQDNNIVKVNAFNADGTESELTEADQKILKMYTQMMLNSIKK